MLLSMMMHLQTESRKSVNDWCPWKTTAGLNDVKEGNRKENGVPSRKSFHNNLDCCSENRKHKS